MEKNIENIEFIEMVRIDKLMEWIDKLLKKNLVEIRV
jgi:hypothetical protein